MKESSIILLNEATSFADADEFKIQEALKILTKIKRRL